MKSLFVEKKLMILFNFTELSLIPLAPALVLALGGKLILSVTRVKWLRYSLKWVLMVSFSLAWIGWRKTNVSTI